jgi:hypothetical protein
LNIQFSKEEIQMANKYMKKCLTPLAIKEMQMKTSLKFHFITVRMAVVKKTSDKCWQGCGKKELIRCWWECKLVQPLWKSVWRFRKKTKDGYI